MYKWHEVCDSKIVYVVTSQKDWKDFAHGKIEFVEDKNGELKKNEVIKWGYGGFRDENPTIITTNVTREEEMDGIHEKPLCEIPQFPCGVVVDERFNKAEIVDFCEAIQIIEEGVSWGLTCLLDIERDFPLKTFEHFWRHSYLHYDVQDFNATTKEIVEDEIKQIVSNIRKGIRKGTIRETDWQLDLELGTGIEATPDLIEKIALSIEDGELDGQMWDGDILSTWWLHLNETEETENV